MASAAASSSSPDAAALSTASLKRSSSSQSGTFPLSVVAAERLAVGRQATRSTRPRPGANPERTERASASCRSSRTVPDEESAHGARRTTRTERREAERAPRDATGRGTARAEAHVAHMAAISRCVSLNCVDGEAVGRPADASKGTKVSRACAAKRPGVRRTNARVSDAARRARQCARRGRKSNGWEGSFPRERTLRESQFRMSLMSGQDFKNV